MNAVPQLGHLPYMLLETRLREMKGSQLCVYVVIARHVDERWTARPIFKRIAKITGLSQRTVMRAVDQLNRNGLITVVHGGGSGICNRHTPVTNLDVQGAEACNANGDTQAVTFSSAENGDKPSRKRRRGRLRSLPLAHRKPDTPSVMRTDEREAKTKTRPAGLEPAAYGLGNRPAQVRPFPEVIGAF